MTLFDTSVIIDARDPGSAFHEWSKGQLALAVIGDPLRFLRFLL
jgi:predicted nucleic acid-binding protein